MSPRRSDVYVAGRGAVSCFGADHAALIESIFAGEVGIRSLERLADTDCLTDVAAEVPKPVRDRLLPGSCPPTELPFQFALAAAREALSEWGGRERDLLLVVASTKAELTGIITDDGTGFGSPITLARRLASSLALTGPVRAISCACASGLSALAFAARQLRASAAQRALVVGTDGLCPFILRGFSSLLALSKGPCRPFDADRDGLSLGEGAGAILLSTRSEESRGFTLAGWGESNDANHITGPSRDGAGLATAIERALHYADTPPAAIDFVHLHGTGTPYNDAMEGKALARVFDTTPAAAGSKGQIGHTLGAAGMLESLITLAALERGVAPGNAGLTMAGADCPTAVRPDPWPLPRARLALKIAAGFGGINAALVWRRAAP